MDYDAEYSRYCLHGHQWVECTCYEPDDTEYDEDGESLTTYIYQTDREIFQPTCSCINSYCENTGETIRVQCASCCDGAFVTYMIGGHLNSIDSTNDVNEKVQHLGALFRYIYTVESFLLQHLSFTYSLYEKCKELEVDPKCAPILRDIRAVKLLIESL